MTGCETDRDRQAGSTRAEPPDFEALLRRARPPRRPGWPPCSGAADPEDLAQEAFCRLVPGPRDRLDGTPERTVAYLNRIVVNEVRSRARRDQTARRSAHLLPVPRADDGDGGDRQAVIEELSRLPLRQREAHRRCGSGSTSASADVADAMERPARHGEVPGLARAGRPGAGPDRRGAVMSIEDRVTRALACGGRAVDVDVERAARPHPRPAGRGPRRGSARL